MVQYFGHKERIESEEELTAFYATLEKTFNLDFVFEHTENNVTMFYQDIAVDVV